MKKIKNKKYPFFGFWIWSLGFIPIIIGMGGCAWVVKDFVPPTLSLLYTKEGEGPTHQFGTSLAAADVNGDGKADFIVSAPNAAAGGKMNSGILYVYSGADGTILWRKEGVNPEDRIGLSLSSPLTDINADGKIDVLVGSPKHDNWTGSVEVYSVADGTSLWHKRGGAGGDEFGSAVAMGDVNGDGKAEIVVGASGVNNRTGALYVYASSDGNLIWQKSGALANDRFGFSLALADLNGDGIKEIVVGIPEVNGNTGSVEVYLGAEGTLSWRKSGEKAGEKFGSVLAAGDVNGDGKSDLIVGAPGASVNSTANVGAVYVYAGADKSLLYSKTGTLTSEAFGSSLAAGDVNGDGKSDFVVGAPNANGGLGSIYVFSGADGSLIYQKSSLLVENFGSSLALGDINGDGKSDIVVGAPASKSGNGAVYVYLSP